MSYIKSDRFFNIVPVLIFALFSLVIVFAWFRSGLYYGGAEVGISPFYNSQRYFEIQKYIWWGDVAPGMLVPIFVSSVPLYFVFSVISKVATPLFIQGGLFFSLLFLMGYGFYLFSLSILGRKKYKYAFIAGIFYMFNSYMMVEVWHRFLYTGFFLAASLPILALFWKRWVSKGNFVYLVIFLLTNFVFAYMFGNLTSVIAIWLLLFMITGMQLFPWPGKKESFVLIYRFLLGFMFFTATNLWWMIAVFKVSTSVLPQQHSLEDNIFTIVNISKQTILPFVLQFANPYYLFYTHELGEQYSNILFLILPWIPAIVIFIGVLASLKNKLLAGFGFFYLLTIILAKGAASPFGFPYIWGFMNIYILAIIRNPFEKLGVLLPFFGSLLFVIGLERIFSWVSIKIGIVISRAIAAVILLTVLVYALPMFTGAVFNNPIYPLAIKVPQFYKDADNWLRLQKELSGNILHLPFPSKDVVTYNWEKGYHGIEINDVLFTSLPSITRNVGIKRVDDTLKSLSFIFTKPFSEDKNQILKLLQSLNVKYIVLHKDTRWEDVSTYGKDTRLNDPAQIEIVLNNLEALEKTVVFGDLVIFKLKDEFYLPKITFPNNMDLVFPGESNILQILTFATSNNQLTPPDKRFDKSILDNSSQMIIFPEKILYNFEASQEILEAMLNQIIASPTGDSSSFYQMISISRYFSQTGEFLSQTLTDKVIAADSILLNLIKKETVEDSSSVQSILTDYGNQIDGIFKKGFSGSSLQIRFSAKVAKVFTMHLYSLELLSESKDIEFKQKVQKTIEKLKNYLVSNKILPNYSLDKKDIQGEVERRVHIFNIPIDGKYELLMTDPDTLSLYPDDLSKINFLLDGKNLPVKMSKANDFISLGEIELKEGTREISYNIFPSINLAASVDKFIIEGSAKILDNQVIRFEANGQTGAAIKIPLSGVNGGDVYQVNFEGQFENPREFYIQVVEDTNFPDSPYDCSKVSCYPVNSSLQTHLENYSLTLNPLNLASRNANFQIILPTVSTVSPLLSVLEIRNLKISRVMDNNLILRKKALEQLVSTPSAQLIDYKKINNVVYEGRIKLEKPSFMFFKETFNPNWILKLTQSDKTYAVDKHYLGNLYGNTYYIEMPGEYNFKLEFEPQKNVDIGLTISAVSWVGIILTLIYSKFRGRKSYVN